MEQLISKIKMLRGAIKETLEQKMESSRIGQKEGNQRETSDGQLQFPGVVLVMVVRRKEKKRILLWKLKNKKQ